MHPHTCSREARPMSKPDLFTPIAIGALTLPNRIVMAPMTRIRAGEGNAPVPLNATYYAQRASAGLLITEASQVSPQGVGYPRTPGIHTDSQIQGWRAVTDAVHAKGGRIFLQLWHVGRISHPTLQPCGALPVAPSAIRPEGKAFTESGFLPFETPRALETAELPGIVEQYRVAPRNALAAGFAGVDINAANGYLIDQFLRDKTNHRTAAYGGSIETRARLLLDVTLAVIDFCSPDRVGVRISPISPANACGASNPQPLFTYVVAQLT